MIRKYFKRFSSDASIVNVDSNKMQNEVSKKLELRATLDSIFIDNRFKISKKIASVYLLEKALNLIRTKQHFLVKQRLFNISKEIMKGTYKFQPLISYKIPKKIRMINRGKYLKVFFKKKNYPSSWIFNKNSRKCCLEYRQVFKETFENKVVAKAILLVLIEVIKENKNFSENLFSFLSVYSSVDVINFLKVKFGRRNLTFACKAKIKEFFSSIKKVVLFNGLKELVTIKDNKFYHLIKSYLNCGYEFFLLKKSKKIGARSIKKILKNKSKFLVYKGTLLANFFSSIVNEQILRTVTRMWVDQVFIKKRENKFFYKKIYSTSKSSIFIKKEKNFWLFFYGNIILLLGTLSKIEQTSFYQLVIKVFKKYGFIFDIRTIKKSVYLLKPITFLGFEIFKSKESCSLTGSLQKSKLIIRPNFKQIFKKLVEQQIVQVSNVFYSSYRRRWGLHKCKKNENEKSFFFIRPNKFFKKYKILHYTKISKEEPQKIIDFFNFKIINLKLYYNDCDQLYKLNLIFFILRISCYKTLVNKYKLGTIRKLFKKFGNNLKKLVTQDLIKSYIKKESLKKYIKQKNIVQRNQIYENFKKTFNAVWFSDSKSIFGSCLICNSIKKLEAHFVNSLDDIWVKIKKNKYNYYNIKYIQDNSMAFFDILHIIQNRKNIAICVICYTNIDSNIFPKKSIAIMVQKLKLILKGV